ncbi:MAG: alpha-1,2-fucosyltransferase, partial [Bacteroidaceae bacterium]|nr:alpha-1,2-fucosyltransferase [Bacteroidaceae bacterium]
VARDEQSFEQLKREVSTYYRSVEGHPNHEEFFKRLHEEPLSKLVNEYVPQKKTKRKGLINKLIKRIFPNDFRIIWDKPGQTCNRLWSYLDTIGWSIRTQNKTYVLFWDKDIRHFDRLRNNPYIKFPLYSKTLIKWFGDAKYQKLLTWIFANRFLNRFYARTNSKKFVCSWKQRASKEYFPYVRNEIRDIYTPNQNIIDEVKPVMEHYKREGYFIIGVHIRRGDYKTFENGKYYFELDEYKRQMQALCELYQDKKVCFAISTNENIDHSVFKGLEICRTANTTAIHDLYMLSQCNRIIGPLSTFSRWASFYGKVPLCFIDRENIIRSDEKFSVIEDFYHFENGVEIVNLTDKNTRV